MLRLTTSPFLLQGKLYDYYLPSDIHNTQEEQDVDSSEDEEGPLSEEIEKDVYSEEETDEGKDTMDDSEETEESAKSDKPDWVVGINGFRSVDNRAGTLSAHVEGRNEGSEETATMWRNGFLCIYR